MSIRPYRVIQWATGQVGKAAIRHFVENPTFQLVGVYVSNPEKVGKDAGELAGVGPLGVSATGDVDAILALDADCVHFAPLTMDVDVVCRLLRSGKNVVTPSGFWYPTERYQEDFAKLEAACAQGRTSFHGAGIHPGFAGDVLPFVATRLMQRVDCVHVQEIVNFGKRPSSWIGHLGFGKTVEEISAKPPRSPEAIHFFAQSMAMIVEGLGKKIEKLTAEHDFKTAARDIEYPGGVIRAGTLAGQHYEWKAWVEGAPLVVFHTFWVMSEDVAPEWKCEDNQYRIIIEGDRTTELTLQSRSTGREAGLLWTAMAGVSAIPDVCDAKPGVITQFDLGLLKPRGLVRRPALEG
jgi:hypothetical protein